MISHNFPKLKGRLSIGLSYFLALLYAMTIFVPIYFVVISSFKGNLEIFGSPLALPTSLAQFGNYLLAQERVNILQAMGISALITSATLALNISTGFFAAYAIARMRLRISTLIEAFFGAGFLIPVFAVIVPVFLLAAQTGLLYNPVFLVIFYAASHLPLTVVFLATHMRQIPSDLEDAAMIDGANRYQIIWHIFFPLSSSAVVTVVVMNFIACWNEYLFALLLLEGDMRTVQMVIPMLRSERLVDYGLVSAGIVISMIPIYLLFIFFQEKIVTGMMGGAVKS